MLVFLFKYFMHYCALPLDDTVNTSITIPSFRTRKGMLIIVLSFCIIYIVRITNKFTNCFFVGFESGARALRQLLPSVY